MKPNHKIVKTEDPEGLEPCRIVSRPAGNCPYYLICLHEEDVARHGLQEDIIEDTSVFFEGYDLSEPETEEEMIP